MATEAPSLPAFVPAVRERTSAFDVFLLLAVPFALVGVFTLPRTTTMQYALTYTSPTVLTAYTSHFVHASETHLFANLLAYFLIVPTAYLCCTLSDRRDAFFAAFATFLVAFPLVLSGLNVVLSRPRVGLGFSGINMAFFGLLPTALTYYVRENLIDAVDLDHSPLFFFVGAGFVAYFTAPTSAGRTVALVLTIGASAIYAWSLYRSLRYVRPELRMAFTKVGYFELAVGSLALFSLFPFVAFPPDIVEGNVVLNIYSHLLGYCLGYIAPYVTFRFTDWR